MDSFEKYYDAYNKLVWWAEKLHPLHRDSAEPTEAYRHWQTNHSLFMEALRNLVAHRQYEALRSAVEQKSRNRDRG